MEMLTTFRALADPTRLRIMLLLLQMELSVGELAIVLDQSQPRVSRHVRILGESGLAERRKEGSWVFLRPYVNRVGAAYSEALTKVLRDPEFPAADLAEQNREDLARLQAVRAQREEQAAQYFASEAGNWDATRSLYVPEADVETALVELVGGDSLGRLLDIGTGTGRMVELFAEQASEATALDKSPEMLRFARTKLQDVGDIDLDLVLGDFNALPLEDQSFDTILLHQVLHFAQNPERVLMEAGRVSAEGARIVVVDFAPHEREELRKRDAHVRLGFSDDQIGRLFEAGNFRLTAMRELAGSELTVKIWLGIRGGLRPSVPDRDGLHAVGDTRKTNKRNAA